MKRFLAFALTCLLAACTSQHRVDPEPDFANPNPAPDENPDEPRLGEIESLISQAKLDIKRRDYDEARVKLHQVFRRDRWNPEANTIYQDLQISRGKGDALYQEYLDLYEANKQRGDALWFHLRPLLIKRGIKACDVEKHTELTAEQRQRIEELEKQEADLGGSEADRAKRGKEALIELLKLDPMRGDRVARLAYLFPEETVKTYRDQAEENPTSGDAQYLYAMALWGSNSNTAASDDPLDVLRKAWILELPGVYLRSGLAELALANWARKRIVNGTPPIQWTFEAGISLLNVALNFYRIAALSAPGTDFSAKIKEVQESAVKNKAALEDLSQKK